MSSDDDAGDLPAALEDIISTGVAADAGDDENRLKGLPRLLRYAMLSTGGSQHVVERLVAEIHELCPNLPQSAAWALERTFDTGEALAAREIERGEPCAHRLVNVPAKRSPRAGGIAFDFAMASCGARRGRQARDI